ncbi:hypothetical protein Tco_0046810 [Tanacetum coccineum]
MMSFFTAVVSSRYPTTNNQLRNSSNPRQQATINNGRVTLQPIQGRQTSVAAGTSRTYTLGASGNNSGKQKPQQNTKDPKVKPWLLIPIEENSFHTKDDLERERGEDHHLDFASREEYPLRGHNKSHSYFRGDLGSSSRARKAFTSSRR